MTDNNKVVGDAIGFVGGPVGAVFNHGQAYVGEALNPAAMTNRAELRRLAGAATKGEWNRRRVFGQLNVQDENFMLGDDDAKYIAAANPEVVTGLLDELDAKDNTLLALTTRHFAESWSRRSTDAKLDEYLSAGIAQLQEERDAALAERDEHREISGCMDLLRRDLIEAGVIGDACPPMFMTEGVLGYFGQMKAELEACRKDAERYRWLRDKGLHNEVFAASAAITPGRGPYIAIQFPTSGKLDVTALGCGADAYVDAAMSQEANHA